MRKLSTPAEFAALEQRLGFLTPDSHRQWGTMSAGGMLCHLCDSFRFALGERPVKSVSRWIDRTLVKWIALHTGIPWPKGVPTRPEMDQRSGGTAPEGFDCDRTQLIALMHRFAQPAAQRPPHPIFGELTESEWQYWGWRHVDHHLRQFSV